MNQPHFSPVCRTQSTFAIALVLLAAILAMLMMQVALGVVLAKVQGETFTEPSTYIAVRDSTEDEGQHLRWEFSAPSTAWAPTVQTFSTPVKQINVRARSATGTEDLALYMDGTASTNKIATFDNLSSVGFMIYSAPVSIPSGQHTFYFAPAANLTSEQRMSLDWVQFEDTAPADPCVGATPVSPTTNLQEAIDAPGVYCLHAGAYTEADELINITAANVTIRNFPGERAFINGQIKIQNSATNFKAIGTDVSPDVEGIVFNATYGNVFAGRCQPLEGTTSPVYCSWRTQGNHVYGSGYLFQNVEFDGENDVLANDWWDQANPPPEPDRAGGVCALFTGGGDWTPTADGIIAHSDVHNCGFPPNQGLADPNPGDHGLYFSEALRPVIRHNLIHHNGTRGIQIRNETDYANVYGNIVDTNGNAVIFDDVGATNNTVHNNVLTSSNRGANSNTDYTWDAAAGNRYENNCVWGPPALADGLHDGIVYSNNYNAPANPYGTWPNITDSTCAAKLPARSPFR